MQTLSLCLQMSLASIRGQMQYRVNFIVNVLAGLFFQGMGIVFVWALLQTFPSLGGWGFREVALLYGMRLTSHGIYLLFFSNLVGIDDFVRQGQYARLLVRPIHPLLQLMFSNFRITVLGDLIGGVAILIGALGSLDIAWTPAHILMMIGAIIGGGMIDGAFQILPAAMSFRYIESWPARVIFDDIFTRFGNYPINIFGHIAERLLTFIIPLAFVAWLPAAALLDKPTFLPHWTAWLSLPVGMVVITLALRTFMRASRGYQSSGS